MPASTLLQKLQHAARHGRVELTKHAEKRALERKATAQDIQNALRTARKATVQPSGTIKVAGEIDLDGIALDLVVKQVPTGLTVITLMDD